MGYLWQQTRNVLLGGLVHEAWRDVARTAERGRVQVFCYASFFYTSPKRGQTLAKPTNKHVTCLLCIGIGVHLDG